MQVTLFSMRTIEGQHEKLHIKLYNEEGYGLWKIYAILSSQSVKKLCLEIKPLVSEYYHTLERIMTSRCNVAVGDINSTEKFHRLAIRFSNIFCSVSQWCRPKTVRRGTAL